MDSSFVMPQAVTGSERKIISIQHLLKWTWVLFGFVKSQSMPCAEDIHDIFQKLEHLFLLWCLKAFLDLKV